MSYSLTLPAEWEVRSRSHVGLEGCFQQPSQGFGHGILSPHRSHAKPLVLWPGKTTHLLSFLLLRLVPEVLMKRGSRGCGSFALFSLLPATLEAEVSVDVNGGFLFFQSPHFLLLSSNQR